MNFAHRATPGWRSIGAVMFAAGLCSFSAAGQAPPTAAQPEANLTNIAGHLEKSLGVVRRITDTSRSSQAVEEIRRDLPELSKNLREFEQYTRALPAQPRSPLGFSVLRGAWADASSRLAEWQAAIIAESRLLQDDLTSLEFETRLLGDERQRLYGNQVQSELVSTIDRVREQIERAAQVARTRQNALLAVQADLTELEIRIHLVQQSLRDIATLSRSRLQRLDSPPIWSLWRSRSEPNAEQAFQGPPPTRNPFFILYLTRLVLLLALVYLLFLFPLLLLRRWARPWLASSSSFAVLKGVLLRPFSAALMPALLAGDVYRGQLQLSALLLVIPMVRVIPALLPPSLRRSLWGLAGLFVLDWALMQYSPAATFGMRIGQLVRVGLTGVWLLWLRRSLPSEPAIAGLRRLWSPASWTALGLVAVALASSAAGATILARYLASGLVRAVFGSILLYGLFRISQAFFQILIESRTRESDSASVQWAPAFVAGKLVTIMRWLAVAGIALIVTGAFDLTEPILSFVRAGLASQVSVGAINFSLGSLMIVVVSLMAGVLFSRIIRFFLVSGVYGRIALQRGTSEVISKLVHYTVLTAAFLFALSATGIDLNRFTLLVGALGVGLGFGLQNIVNNFICGLILLFERPLKVGDIVSIEAVSGMVTDIGIRSTQIHTWDGADVSVPNANVVSKDLTNWKGLNEQRGTELMVGVAYGTDPERVMRLLIETAQKHPLVMKDPVPAAFFAGFGDSSLNFSLRYWSLIRDWLDVKSEMHTAVYQRLVAEEIEIPFPQRDLHLRDAEALIECIQSKDRQKGESGSR